MARVNAHSLKEIQGNYIKVDIPLTIGQSIVHEYLEF